MVIRLKKCIFAGPSYMQFLLNLQPEEIVLEPMDIDEINRMASEFLRQ